MKTLFELKSGYGGQLIIYPKNDFNPQPFIKVKMLNNETTLQGTKELRLFANNILKAFKEKEMKQKIHINDQNESTHESNLSFN